jgi:hypothetical protein
LIVQAALRNLSFEHHIYVPLQCGGITEIMYEISFNRVGFTPFSAATRET